MPIRIEIDQSDIDAALRRLEKIPYALQRAVIPAVSEMMQGVKEHLADYLESNVPLPSRLRKQALRVSSVMVRSDTVGGEITVRSAKHIPLIEYDVRPGEITARLGMPSRRWPGFTYGLQGSERRQSKDYIQGAGLPFIARMPGGHLGVYFRPGYQSGVRQSGLWGKGKRGVTAHAAIKQLYGPDVQYHVANPQVEDSIVRNAREVFPMLLSLHVERVLATFGGGA